MIPKSGNWFSKKLMLEQKAATSLRFIQTDKALAPDGGLRETVKQGSPTGPRATLVKIAPKLRAKVVRQSHGRYVICQRTEVTVPKQLFWEILRLIDAL